MTYPHMIQFETRALEAEAQATLARERRAARTSRRTIKGLRRLVTSRTAGRAPVVTLEPSACEQ